MAAIAGIGQTEFSKESGRSELQLACEAVKAAIDDAGLKPSDVDGMVTFTMDTSDEIEIARNVGIGDLTFFSRVHHGGGAAAGTVVQAAMAVATGMADVVVCYRAFNERSGFRFGGVGREADGRNPAVHGELRAVRAVDACGMGGAARAAVHVDLRRHQRGLRPDLRRRPRARGHAIPTPGSTSVRSRSRTIRSRGGSSNPCCACSTAARRATAASRIVVTSTERARDLRQPPAVITAAVQGAAADGEMMTSYYRDDITGLPEMGVVAEKLWRDSGLTPTDISTAFLYDHFTPFVFAQLEELGFCGRGEAKDFATIERLSLGGELPINTNGGLLGEAYIHGMNGITEGVRQVRGTSYNQVDERRARAGHVRNGRADKRIDPCDGLTTPP